MTNTGKINLNNIPSILSEKRIIIKTREINEYLAVLRLTFANVCITICGSVPVYTYSFLFTNSKHESKCVFSGSLITTFLANGYNASINTINNIN